MRIDFVMGEDWEGVYFDGVLSCENHSLSAYGVISELNSVKTSGRIDCYMWNIDEDYLEECGGLPKHFKDIPTKVLDLEE